MSAQSSPQTLGVAMVGHGFMGAAHSQGWRVAPRFFDLPAQPVMQVVAGRDAGRARAAAQRWGWADATGDWRAVLERDDVQIVDICAPGSAHAEVAIAALEAGKHVLCEKPLANTLGEAEAMADAAQRAAARGVFAMVGFSYRRVPALALARQMIADGFVGDVRHVQASYLQDWLVDPDSPMSWRLDAALAGSGALGDIGAHVIDMVQFLTATRLSAVSGLIETFVTTRPLVAGHAGIAGGAADAGATTARGRVTVDDAAFFTGRLGEGPAAGALASFRATRFATGRKNALQVEVSGSQGAIAFDLEEMNVLSVYDRRQPAGRQGFTRVMVTEGEHPYMAAWWPAGHTIGYEHTFSHQARDLVVAIAEGRQPEPSFAEGLAVQRVLDAVARSSVSGSTWVSTAPGEA